MNKDFNFEIAMARLAEIANELEKDSLPLDQQSFFSRKVLIYPSNVRNA